MLTTELGEKRKGPTNIRNSGNIYHIDCDIPVTLPLSPISRFLIFRHSPCIPIRGPFLVFFSIHILKLDLVVLVSFFVILGLDRLAAN